MKKLLLAVLAVVAVISIGSFAYTKDNAKASPAKEKIQVAPTKDNAKVLPTKVIVYYFHGSFRCYTCTHMEKYSREAVETNFKKELNSGKLEFKAVNVEERDNEHFVDDYKLYTKSLILSKVEDGQEVKSKNLDKIWQLAWDKKKFISYVTGEVAAFIKDVK